MQHLTGTQSCASLWMHDPLADPNTGIGRYTTEMLRRLVQIPNTQWFFYSTEEFTLPFETEGNVLLRSLRVGRGYLATLAAQAIYSIWSQQDNVTTFWSPRHHLPLLQGSSRRVLTIHDLIWWRVPETLSTPRRLLERFLMPASIKRATDVIAVSHSTARDIRACVKPDPITRIAVIREASSLSTRTIPSPKSKKPTQPFILSVAPAEPRKNLLRLIDAYALARAGKPNLPRLLLAGNGGRQRKIAEARIAQLGLSKSVEFVDSPTDSQLIELYSRCLVLISVSLYEGFNLPVLEAQSFGRCVIASNNSGTKETAGKGGQLVDPNSTEEIAKALIELSEDEQRRQYYETLAKQNASQFDWKIAAVETAAVLLGRNLNTSEAARL